MVAGLRTAGRGHVLRRWIVSRLSQVDRGAGVGQHVEATSYSSTAASARLAQGGAASAA